MANSHHCPLLAVLKRLFMDKVLPVSTRAWREAAEQRFANETSSSARFTAYTNDNWIAAEPALKASGSCWGNVLVQSPIADEAPYDAWPSIRFLSTSGTVVWVSRPDEHGIGLKLHDDESKEFFVSLPVAHDAFAFGERISIVHAIHPATAPLHLASVNLTKGEWWEHQTSRGVANFFDVDSPAFSDRMDTRIRDLIGSMAPGAPMKLVGARANLRLA